jgi:DNA gyrase subunit B
MPLVIEKGYLYIAQPPLYKVKKGQKERYLKNEAELAEFLLSSGLDGIQIKSAKDTLASSTAIASLKAASRFTKAVERMARRIHPDVVRGLIAHGVTPATLEDKGAIEAVLLDIAKKAQKNNVHFEYTLAKDSEHGAWFATVQTVIQGAKRVAPINVATLDSPEYEELTKHWQAILTMGAGPYQILVDGKEAEMANDGEDLARKIVERAKNGLNVQRYKGLGEMNPEQLWETTMDPARRTLLQVSVDDAVEADGIFSVLMGDQVEPRRQFIEENALRVRNLDV